MQGNVAVADRQYQNHLCVYHLVKNMNSALNKIVIVAIEDKWINGAKDIVMGYADKSFLEFMD